MDQTKSKRKFVLMETTIASDIAPRMQGWRIEARPVGDERMAS